MLPALEGNANGSFTVIAAPLPHLTLDGVWLNSNAFSGGGRPERTLVLGTEFVVDCFVSTP